MSEKLMYIAFYSDSDTTKKRQAAPAADTKIASILETLHQIGYNPEIISMCGVDDRSVIYKKYPGYVIDENQYSIHFFDSYASMFMIIRVLGRVVTREKIKHYIRKQQKNGVNIAIVYHSLGLLNVLDFVLRRRIKTVLEVEEIYADVLEDKTLRRRELRYIDKADAYIFPTKLLDNMINQYKKKSVIIHGTYQVMQDRKCRIDDGVIHVLYAGTLDPRKGGAMAAAAATLLPDNYHVHILGFGSNEEMNKMKTLIARSNIEGHAQVTYEGLLKGEEYIRFLQSCHIGLSTQNPEAAFNATSFPSKILSYLANGLHVVSIRIPAITDSAVGDMLTYYDKQTPENIARAILSVDLSADYDSRERIIGLSKQFEHDLAEMLREIDR